MMEKPTKISNFINNVFVPTEEHFESYNPSTGKVLCLIPDSGKREADVAIESAAQAFKTWSITSVKTRADLLNRIADEIEKRIDEFALAESTDQGKPLSLALNVEIPRAIENFRFFASSLIAHRNYSTNNLENKTINYTTETPSGVAVLIVPWNLPLYLLSWKIAPCIASGCTCVCKPSEFTSLTAYLLCDALLKAGIPEGVCNMVFGYGFKIGNDLITHPEINLISFTGNHWIIECFEFNKIFSFGTSTRIQGGTVTGSKIKAATSHQPKKKLSLELGGKNAGIVFPDADLDKFINDIGRSCFQNSGQICLCSSRYFVHVDIFDKFLEKLKEYARSIVIGDPLKSKTKMGPVCSKEHYEKVMSYIKLAVKNGHQIVCGETVDKKPVDCDSNGYYILPTVITNLDDDSELMKDEIFGPVACVTTFHDEDEVVNRANNTRYGLAATIWTENLSKAHKIAQNLQCGYIWINCFLVRDLRMPFGGFKDSGTGREGYPYSFDFFTEKKTVCVCYA